MQIQQYLHAISSSPTADVALGSEWRRLWVWDERVWENFRGKSHLKGKAGARMRKHKRRWKACVMMEASPSSSLEMREAEFAFF